MSRWARYTFWWALWVGLGLSATALPDLVVSDLRVEPSAPQAGEWVVLEATILNRGSSGTESPFFVRFLLDGREIAMRPVAERLDSDHVKRVSTEWLATPGSHQVSVEVDPPMERIAEANEANNTNVRALQVMLDPEMQAALGPLKIAVAAFDDLTGSGFLRVGEGVADKLSARLSGIGLRVLSRSEIESFLQAGSLDPALIPNLAQAAHALGVDVLIAGAVTRLEVFDSSLQLGFLAVNSASVDVDIAAYVVDTSTASTLAYVPANAHDEGMTGFSLDLGGFLSLLQAGTPDICEGGLRTARSWYNIGESVPVAYRNPFPPGWFSVEITTLNGSFVRWLGWQYIAEDGCGVWHWNQLAASGLASPAGVYTAKVWDGVSYVASVTFQVRPGLSLTIPPVSEITVGTERFDETVVGSALDLAIDRLTSGLLDAMQAAPPSESEPSAWLMTSSAPLDHAPIAQVAAVLPDGRIAINIGASSGVAEGDIFDVLEVANVIVDPQSLVVSSYDELGVKGSIVIREVRDLVSYGVQMSDFQPAVGDIVRRASGS